MNKTAITSIAIVSGLTAANMYYIQPLVPAIQTSLSVTYDQASMLYSFSLAGNAASLFLLIPLGDFYDRKKLLLSLYGTSSLSLAVFYLTSNYYTLALMAFFIGVGASSIPLIIAILSKRKNNANAIGNIMAGVLLGIIASRVISSMLNGLWGWKSVYLISALAMLVSFIGLWALFPESKQTSASKNNYKDIISSNIHTLIANKAVRFYSINGFLLMFIFSAFWSNISSHLIRQYDLSSYGVGIFSFAGVSGAISAIFSTSLLKKAKNRNSFFYLCMGATFLLILAFGNSITISAMSTLILDASIQIIHINNQKQMYEACKGNESRAASCYMTSFVTGGALGGYLSSLIYTNYEWTGILALCLLVCSLLTHLNSGEQNELNIKL